MEDPIQCKQKNVAFLEQFKDKYGI